MMMMIDDVMTIRGLFHPPGMYLVPSLRKPSIPERYSTVTTTMSSLNIFYDSFLLLSYHFCEGHIFLDIWIAIPSWWTQLQDLERLPQFQSQQERRSPPSEVGQPGGDDEGGDDDGQPGGDDDGDNYHEKITALIIRYWTTWWLWSAWSVDLNNFHSQIKWRPLGEQ